MREIAALAGIAIAALLFAAGLVYGMPWLLLLGFMLMPVAFLFGITGGPATEATARSGAKPTNSEQTPHPTTDRREAQEEAPSEDLGEREETT